MAIQSLLVLFSLAVAARSWPQSVDSHKHAGGSISLPVVRSPGPGLVSRNAEVQVQSRSDVAYFAELQIGTPPQKVYAQLDTGSFELWVNPDCASLSTSADRDFCHAIGQYQPDKSSTGHKTHENKTLAYGGGRAEITYYIDDIALSEDAKLRNVKFGVAEGGSENEVSGVLGMGYGHGKNAQYRTVADELTEQGVVETKAFSVALGSKGEDGGVIVLGGVDTAKFDGELAGLPIIPAEQSPDGMARYWVQMESLSHSQPDTGSKTWDGTRMPVFLDTGSTLTLLPPRVVESVAADLGSEGQDDAGFYNVDCGLVDQPGTLDFAFDGVTIKVPYKEAVREFHSTESSSCYLGIAPSQDFALLGDTFLRSAYTVFDLDSDTVFMAPYKNCGSHVTNIESSSDLNGMEGSC